MKNKYFYPIFKLKAKSWIRYWLLKKTEFKGKLSEILEGFSFNLQNTLRQKFVKFEIQGHSIQDGKPSPENEVPILSSGENGSITEKITNGDNTEEQTYTIPVQAPFRSIGDVRDIFFKNTQDSPYYDENLVENGWYERHNIEEIIVDGNLDGFHFGFTFESGAGNVFYKDSEYKLAKSPLSDRITGNILCNRLIAKPESTTITGIEGISITLRSNAINVTLGGDYLTKELKNAYASENPLIIVFESQDPTNLLCTTEQTNILENIPSTFSGQTNVFSEDEVKAYLKIQYWESDTNG